MTTHVTIIDDEFELLIDHPVVLVRRNGQIVVDHLGHPINYWLPEAAVQAVNAMRVGAATISQ